MTSTVRKLTVLRTELRAYHEFSNPTLNFGSAAHGVIHRASGSWIYIQRWLMPEVLLRLDSTQTAPVYLIITEADEPTVLRATQPEIDEWLKSNEGRLSNVELGVALRQLESISSRTLSQSDLSKAQRALSELRRLLSKR